MNAKILKADIVKHLPQILSIISCAGVGAVAYFSGRNTLKAKEVLDAKKAELGAEKLPAKETVKTVWKYYIPTGIAMGLTMGAMIASERISAGQLASMTAACGYIAAKSAAIEKKAAAELGEEKMETIRKEAIISSADDVFYAENYGTGDQLCYDAFSGRFFYSTVEDVEAALNDFNADWVNQVEDARNGSSHNYGCTSAYFCMNDLYDYLGLHRSYFGEEFGWCIEGDDDDTCGPGGPASGIEFNTYHSSNFENRNFENLPDVYVIEMDSCDFPYQCWMEY